MGYLMTQMFSFGKLSWAITRCNVNGKKISFEYSLDSKLPVNGQQLSLAAKLNEPVQPKKTHDRTCKTDFSKCTTASLLDRCRAEMCPHCCNNGLDATSIGHLHLVHGCKHADQLIQMQCICSIY